MLWGILKFGKVDYRGQFIAPPARHARLPRDRANLESIANTGTIIDMPSLALTVERANLTASSRNRCLQSIGLASLVNCRDRCQISRGRSDVVGYANGHAVVTWASAPGYDAIARTPGGGQLA